jgi:hypothetical protein
MPLFNTVMEWNVVNAANVVDVFTTFQQTVELVMMLLALESA